MPLYIYELKNFGGRFVTLPSGPFPLTPQSPAGSATAHFFKTGQNDANNVFVPDWFPQSMRMDPLPGASVEIRRVLGDRNGSGIKDQVIDGGRSARSIGDTGISFPDLEQFSRPIGWELNPIDSIVLRWWDASGSQVQRRSGGGWADLFGFRPQIPRPQTSQTDLLTLLLLMDRQKPEVVVVEKKKKKKK